VSWDQDPPMKRLLQEHPDLPALSEPDKADVFLHAALRDLAARGLAGDLRLLCKKWALFFSPRDADGWHVELVLVFPLALLGLGLLARALLGKGGAGISEGEEMLLAHFLTAFSVVSLIFMDQRFRYVGEPAILVFAAVGAGWAWRRLGAVGDEVRRAEL